MWTARKAIPSCGDSGNERSRILSKGRQLLLTFSGVLLVMVGFLFLLFLTDILSFHFVLQEKLEVWILLYNLSVFRTLGEASRTHGLADL